MDIIKQIKGLDKSKIIRPSYGEASLKSWEPTYDEMMKKLEFIEKYWNNVSTTTNNAVSSQLQSILSNLNNLMACDQGKYVSQKQVISNQIDLHYNDIRLHWSQYAIAALEDSGLLDNVNVKNEYEGLTKKMQIATSDALTKIEKESQEIIAQAKMKADEIENSVRKTAQKISVQEAQEQFKQAAAYHTKNIVLWGSISAFAIIGFIILIIYLLNVEFEKEWTWQIIYYSVIRATLLGFVGTLIAFCLRILKAHLHMKEHSLHRQRIANSIASFAESATNKEQRDLILSRLVDSISIFGNSGMIGGDEEGTSKITIDNINRTLTALKGQN